MAVKLIWKHYPSYNAWAGTNTKGTWVKTIKIAKWGPNQWIFELRGKGGYPTGKNQFFKTKTAALKYAKSYMRSH